MSDRFSAGAIRLRTSMPEREPRCRALIEDHYTATGSLHAAAILNDWETRKLAIRHIVPFPPATGMEAQEKRA